MSIVSLAEAKNYMGLTGTQDDQLISGLIPAAEAKMERDTGRVFAYSSNVVRSYSTDGQAMVSIRDVPANGSNTRVVKLNGVTLNQNSGYWMLPDRRNPEVSTQIQLRYFDLSGSWWLAEPDWFDRNLDNPRFSQGTPLDLEITGAEGFPTPVPGDVQQMELAVVQLMYYQSKSGASGTVATPTGDLIDLAARDPIGYPEFVARWKTVTAVQSV